MLGLLSGCGGWAGSSAAASGGDEFKFSVIAVRHVTRAADTQPLVSTGRSEMQQPIHVI
jgi:hypothetical protein